MTLREDGDKILFLMFLGFMSGVFIRSFFYIDPVLIGICFTVALLFAIYGGVRGGKSVILVSFILFSVAAGTLRFSVADGARGDPALDAVVGKTVSLEGVVSDEPDVRDTHTNLVVSLDTLDENGAAHHVSSGVRIMVPLYPAFSYGDRLQLHGTLERPANFSDELTGKEFDYVDYLAKDSVYYVMPHPHVALGGHGEGNPVIGALYTLKHAFIDHVSRVVPEPDASLAAGVLLGVKQSLGPDLLADFRTAGIIHIVVLSGYNITIVAESLMGFFSFLPRMASLLVGGGSIALFAVMVGAGATVVRASIMALLVVLARAIGREYAIKRALLFAAFVMVLWNPMILAFDPSFQLSFLATVGLLYLAPLIEKRTTFLSAKWGMRDIVAATIATQIFVLPLLVYQTGQLSIVGLPVNLLVLPLVPLTMLTAFLCGTVGFVSVLLSFPFAFVSYVLLQYAINVTEFFAHLPFAAIRLDTFPLWMMVVLYALYGVLYVYATKRNVSILRAVPFLRSRE